jgi:serine/threonine protein kinase
MAVEPVKPETREQELDELLGSYLEALDAGKAPSREELLASHPDLATDLSLFFSDNDKVHSWTAPVLDTLRPADAETTIEAGAGDRHSETTVPGVKLGIFGDYQLLKEIGRGGMSVVYKARQLSLNRLVAIKMSRADRLFTEADSLRFHNEAETIAKLDHPGMVPIYEVGQWDAEGLDAPIMYFSMKLLEGGDLTALCRKAPDGADQHRAARLVASAARALQHAHAQNILHRDLKPSNILLDRDGQAHVTDFGLALCLERDQSLTQTGAIVGTPGYMSPEQAMGRRDLTSATDVYGLGAVLYALLTGRPPFKRESALDTLLHVKERDPDPPTMWNYSLDRTLEAICLKCLAKEPKQRYATAAALAEDLEHWLAGEPTIARPERWPRRVRRLWRRHRSKLTLAAMALLPVTIILLANTVGRGPSPEETEARRQQEALTAMQHDLEAGKSVELIGENGPPGYFRWETAAPRQLTFEGDRGVFTVQAQHEGLLEVVPDPLHEQYSFEAEVRHDSSEGIYGSVGLYFAHTRIQAAEGPGHSLCKLFYNDLADEAAAFPKENIPGNLLALYRSVIFEPIMAGPGCGMNCAHHFRLPIPATDPPWRRMRIVLTKDDLSVSWEGQVVCRLSRTDVARCKVGQDPRCDTASLRFEPRGGLGFYVHKSTASFRNVRLQPILDSLPKSISP